MPGPADQPASPASVTTLAVVIPATNRPPTLDRCVAALELADEAADELHVIFEPADAGPAAARNDGALRATADVIVFVDADVAVHRDALHRIRQRLAVDSGLTAVFGSYDDEPADGGVVSAFRNLLHHYVHQRGGGPATTFWAGIGGVRRREFLAVGGFDAERFRTASVEDIDLGMRLTRAGARIELDPRIQGTHLKRWTLASMLYTDVVRRGVPWVRLLLERRTSSTALNLGWPHRLSAVASLAAVLAVARRRPGPAATALVLLVVANRDFYRLLRQRRGSSSLPVAVGLHVLHHLAGAASVPLGIVSHAIDRASGARRSIRKF
jgi:glycosyl transferase family 2